MCCFLFNFFGSWGVHVVLNYGILFDAIGWATTKIYWWGTVSWFKALAPHPSSVFKKAGFVDWIRHLMESGEYYVGILHWWLFPLCFIDVDLLGGWETKQNVWVMGWAHLYLSYIRSVEILSILHQVSWPLEMGQNLISLSRPFSSCICLDLLNLYSLLRKVSKRGPSLQLKFSKPKPSLSDFCQNNYWHFPSLAHIFSSL